MNIAAQDAPQAASIYERIAMKQATIERINTLKKIEIPKVGDERFTVDRAIQAMKNKMDGFSAELYPTRQDEMKKEKANLVERLAALNTRHAELSDELKNLQGVVLPGLIQETTLDEVAQHRENIETLNHSAQQLRTAIAAQQQAIAQAEADIVQVPDRGAERAAILADLAISGTGQDKLSELDALISAELTAHEESRAKAQPIITRARQTITGLESKLSAVQASIGNQMQLIPDILEQYLMSEIAGIAAHYMDSAQAVREDFLKLVALERIVNQFTGQTKSVEIIRRSMTLPIPQLKHFEEFRMKSYPHLLFDTGPGVTHAEVGYDAYEQSELTRINAACGGLIRS